MRELTTAEIYQVSGADITRNDVIAFRDGAHDVGNGLFAAAAGAGGLAGLALLTPLPLVDEGVFAGLAVVSFLGGLGAHAVGVGASVGLALTS